jgi:hypothetical protein
MAKPPAVVQEGVATRAFFREPSTGRPTAEKGIGVGRASSHSLPTAFYSGKSPDLLETKDNIRQTKTQLDQLRQSWSALPAAGTG